jgi:hypothetical protein
MENNTITGLIVDERVSLADLVQQAHDIVQSVAQVLADHAEHGQGVEVQRALFGDLYLAEQAQKLLERATVLTPPRSHETTGAQS